MSTIDTAVRGTNPLRTFTKWIGGINPSVFMFSAAILAIVFANSSLAGLYTSILNAPVNLEIAGYNFFQIHGHTMTVTEFINDALMVLFFFSVGLEIKREMVNGSLSSVRKAMLPTLAACGGIIMPILLFLAIENQDPIALRGVTIPMATDIAFSLAVLGLLGKRVPVTLKLFLMALAVVDDIAGILVIAIFYSTGIQWVPLVLGLITILVAYLFAKKGVSSSSVYYILLIIVWSFFVQSGIHSTIAGVLLALVVPHRPTIHPKDLEEDMRRLDVHVASSKQAGYVQKDFLDDDYINDMRITQRRIQRTISPVQIMEHEVSPWVHYLVLPLFAFSNSGIAFGDMSGSEAIGVAIAVAVGLFVGKTIGIFGFTYLGTKLRLVRLTPGVTYANVFGISIFGGIGFTVSLFLATLAYQAIGAEAEEYLNMAKLGIIIGTVVSGILGVIVLNAILKWEEKQGRGAASKEYKEYLANSK